MVIFVMSHEQNWRPLFHDLAKRNRSAIARLVEEPRLFHSLNVEVTGAARLHRGASVWTAGLGISFRVRPNVMAMTTD